MSTKEKVIFDATDDGEPVENVDLTATMRNIERRAASESKRYDDYYGIDYLDPANYDLVIDTSDLDVEQVVDTIADFLTQVPVA